MKKKLVTTFFVLFLLLSFPLSVFAQLPLLEVTPSQNYEVEVIDNSASFTFADMKYGDRQLLSPIDSKSYIFSTPPNWRLISGGILEIHYDVFLSGTDLGMVIDGGSYGGNLLVKFNDTVIGTIPFDKSGSYTARLEIPSESLVSILEDGRHLLTISLDGQVSCTYDVFASVTIKSSSSFKLFFEITPPALDLSRLPAPFYLENSIIPDSVRVVVSDNPSAQELQTAINVMAGLGSTIGDDYDIDLISLGNLKNEDLVLHHFIFVGEPSGFSILSQVNFPLTVENGKLKNIPVESADDGVLQLALSPWNPNKALLMVTGNSSAAVVKAGHAISSGNVLTYDNPQLVYVSDAQLQPGSAPIVEDFTLKELGYVNETYSLFDTSGEYIFFVSKEQILTREGYVDLSYYHSSLDNSAEASFAVRLNGETITDVSFKEESQQFTTLRIKLPPGSLIFGENTLEIRTAFQTTPSCDGSGLRDPWLIISEETAFHIPVATDGSPIPALQKDLAFFPDLFLLRSDLGDTAFILSKSNPEGWKIAGDLAYDFGSTINPSIPNMIVSFSDDVEQSVRENYSLIVIGTASASPFLMEINDSLPAPFDPSTNTASERQMQIVYRIPQGVSVGYLELTSSPYNKDASVLVVSGNSNVGLEFASNVLLISDSRSQLAGTFAVTNGTQIAVGRVSGRQFSIVGEGVPGAQPVIVTPIPELGSIEPSATEPPSWFLFVVILSGVLIVVIVAFVVKSVIDKKRLNQIKELKSNEVLNDDTNVQN